MGLFKDKTRFTSDINEIVEQLNTLLDSGKTLPSAHETSCQRVQMHEKYTLH